MSIKQEIHSLKATYPTDCHRKVKDPETGKVETKRWVQDQQVAVTVQITDGKVYWKGAAI